VGLLREFARGLSLEDLVDVSVDGVLVAVAINVHDNVFVEPKDALEIGMIRCKAGLDLLLGVVRPLGAARGNLGGGSGIELDVVNLACDGVSAATDNALNEDLSELATSRMEDTASGTFRRMNLLAMMPAD
jgi:hypothetical protein